MHLCVRNKVFRITLKLSTVVADGEETGVWQGGINGCCF